MKNFTRFASILALLTSISSFSQEELQLTSKDSIIESSTILGLGFNFVDDSGDVFDELFAVGSQWNYVPYPSRISIGTSTKSGFGFEAIGTFNRYKVGNIIDGVVNAEETTYLGVDGRVSYDLNKLFNETSWFDPYLGVGLGYTKANNQPRATYNAVVGFRTWISDRWGLDFSSSGKWAMGNNGATNHIQHAAGVVYQFDIEKGLSKQGEEKLAMIQEMEKEKQRVADSIATADRLKEEALLAERLAQEREKAKLAAAADKAKLDVENSRKSQIENEINALGHAHFALNSSYLGIEAKKVLEGLAKILKSNQGVELQITAHADSRGSDKYNLWLSERRVKRTIDFLVKQGIAAERLTGSGLGEKQLTNHCDDNVYCSEEEHQANRRSEFVVSKF
ncbi:MAG: OmpA family protein [Aurantibacter sp.]